MTLDNRENSSNQHKPELPITIDSLEFAINRKPLAHQEGSSFFISAALANTTSELRPILAEPLNIADRSPFTMVRRLMDTKFIEGKALKNLSTWVGTVHDKSERNKLLHRATKATALDQMANLIEDIIPILHSLPKEKHHPIASLSSFNPPETVQVAKDIFAQALAEMSKAEVPFDIEGFYSRQFPLIYKKLKTLQKEQNLPDDSDQPVKSAHDTALILDMISRDFMELLITKTGKELYSPVIMFNQVLCDLARLSSLTIIDGIKNQVYPGTKRDHLGNKDIVLIEAQDQLLNSSRRYFDRLFDLGWEPLSALKYLRTRRGFNKIIPKTVNHRLDGALAEAVAKYKLRQLIGIPESIPAKIMFAPPELDRQGVDLLAVFGDKAMAIQVKSIRDLKPNPNGYVYLYGSSSAKFGEVQVASFEQIDELKLPKGTAHRIDQARTNLQLLDEPADDLKKRVIDHLQQDEPHSSITQVIPIILLVPGTYQYLNK